MIASEQKHIDTTELTNEIIANGETCFNEGDINSAIKAFQSVLELDPDNVRANSNLGVVLWHSEEHENALEYLKRAYLANPDDKVALTNLAEVYLALQQDQEALRLYNAYLDHHPNENEIRNILKTLQVEPNEDAEASCTDTTDLTDEIIANGEICFNQDDIIGAINAFQSILDLDPDNIQANNNLGVALWHSEKHEDALKHLKRAYLANPDDRVALINLAEVYLALQQDQDALRLYRSYLDRHPDENEIRNILNALQEDIAVSAN